jgi:hypothetical protein
MSDAANWSRIRDVFSRALDLDPALRSSFVRDACDGDSALHAEVTSLLVAHANSGSAMERSPLEAMDRSAIVSLGLGLRAGDRLGAYEIIGLLGAAGMGQVYDARDTALGRRVAIKILSAELALDTAARERFSREAKALAALTHPNIGGIYGLETLPGTGATGQETTALVLELVEGLTLAERLARRSAVDCRSFPRGRTDRRGAGSGPRQGHHPPRPEADEHQDHHEWHCEGARFWPR